MFSQQKSGAVCYDKNMSVQSKRQILVNIFGTFGYISLVLQWLWVSVLFLPQLLENEPVRDFFMPPTDVTSAPPFEFHTPPLLATTLAIAITVVVLTVAVVVLLRLPTTISKTGKKATLKTAEKIVPVLAHHKKLSPKKKRQLTVQAIRILKFTLTVLPFLLLLLVAFIPTSLSDAVVIFVGAFLALGTLAWFSLEYALARIFKIDPLKLL